MKFRDLTADDIEVRVQSVKETGLVLLLYKNARVDMSILDETVGPMNWQRQHELINGNLFCNVGIRAGKDDNREFAEWVWKQDVGTESNTEKEKGQASDSFKRACFCWGIGRELYTAPFMWITAQNCNIKDKKCYDNFSVQNITIKDGKITGLVIYNETMKKEAYRMGAKIIEPTKEGNQTPPPQAPKTPQKPIGTKQYQILVPLVKSSKYELASILKRIKDKYGVDLLQNELTEEQFNEICNSLKAK